MKQYSVSAGAEDKGYDPKYDLRSWCDENSLKVFYASIVKQQESCLLQRAVAKGSQTALIEGHNPAWFPAHPALLSADYLDLHLLTG